MRFFRITDDATYEAVRLSLDAQWGHVAPVTCVDPASVALRDSSGAIVLGVRPEFVSFPAVSAALPSLIASGVVQEITRAEYEDALPKGFP